MSVINITLAAFRRETSYSQCLDWAWGNVTSFMLHQLISPDGAGVPLGGLVLFFARVFDKGVDRSFVELSQFRREGSAWRYASGIVVPKADLPADLGTLRAADIQSIGLRPRE